ncbi:hypothetical protein AYO38_02755 [bacterium SCGC AG-212-C10]|nr:hypothetical protein AYO38_02755 [bacterium SCGC AG-212-C10]
MAAPVRDPKQTPVEPGWDNVDGVLVEKDMGAESDWIATEAIGFMRNFVGRGKLGRVFGQGGGYQYPALDDGRLRFPDVSFVAAEKLPNGIPHRGWLTVPPDLVVEVCSPNDEAEEVQTKVRVWLEGGARLVWVIFPASRQIAVHRMDRTGKTLVDGDMLDGEDVLPGFTVPVGELLPPLTDAV